MPTSKSYHKAALMHVLLFLLLFFPLFGAARAADTLVNIAPEPRIHDIGISSTQELAPGATIYLPGGKRTFIKEILDDGIIITEQNIRISPQGVILEGPDKGLKASFTASSLEISSDQDSAALNPRIETELKKGELPNRQQNSHASGTKAYEIGSSQSTLEGSPLTSQDITLPDAAEQRLTIAELLPTTPLPPAAQGKPEKAPEAKPAGKAPQIEKTVKKEIEPKPAPKQSRQASSENKPARQTTGKKTAPGQEMRIPPEAIHSGNLDFLEGCWQGTRPEYYSKRMIKECFCFGANGKNGKRRVYDSIGKRQCIGASSARLSQNGVLHISSSGAACNDGERWGQAEMECRNSGPRTPCSWLFRDAQNGTQAYEIPFIKVESCGR